MKVYTMALKFLYNMMPAIRKLYDATSAASPGGKRITKREMEKIIFAFMEEVPGAVEAVIEETKSVDKITS